MKQLLLFGLSYTMGINAVNAQNPEYYPSGNMNAPTWNYSRVTHFPNGSFTNIDNGVNGDVLEEATLFSNTFTYYDAYDGAFEVYVNDHDHSYALTDTQYQLVDTFNNLFTFPALTIGNFEISKNYYLFPDKPLLRMTIKIENPDNLMHTATIGVRSNLGSDDETALDSCSTGNDLLTNADRWMITRESAPHHDPILSWIRYGSGPIESTPIFVQKPESGSDIFEDTYPVIVPANEYRMIVVFARMDSTVTVARTNIMTFNSMNFLQTAGYFSGLSDGDKLRIVNWDFNSSTGVKEQEQVNVQLYPNPGTGTFQLTSETTIRNVIITNTSGMEVLQINPDSFQSAFQLENQSAGLYYVKIKTDLGEKTLKLVQN